MVEFTHPVAKKISADVGLRIMLFKRTGLAGALARSQLVQTGDILLTFRPEWGGAGAYPSIQMGISHTAIAYVKNGRVHNLDNPLSEEYLGKHLRGDLSGEHYRTLNLLHVIRPRNLTPTQQANIGAWANLLISRAGSIYPKEISFNEDYNAPKYRPGRPLAFVQHLGRIALGQHPVGNLDMFCSEFVWSVLALRDCDPGTSAEIFKQSEVPMCVKSPMQPMPAIGDFIQQRGDASYVGLADGPLLVIDAMNVPTVERDTLLRSVFAQSPAGLARLSMGHRDLALAMASKYAPLEAYYLAAFNTGASNQAALEIPENYSPASFLINTLLPSAHSLRTMDYVGTLVVRR